jgi:hypothetical protein
MQKSVEENLKIATRNASKQQQCEMVSQHSQKFIGRLVRIDD